MTAFHSHLMHPATTTPSHLMHPATNAPPHSTFIAGGIRDHVKRPAARLRRRRRCLHGGGWQGRGGQSRRLLPRQRRSRASPPRRRPRRRLSRFSPPRSRPRHQSRGARRLRRSRGTTRSRSELGSRLLLILLRCQSKLVVHSVMAHVLVDHSSSPPCIRQNLSNNNVSR
jgi:hypothetical protein